MTPIMVDIYCLIDPDTCLVHYVGQTSAKLNTRLWGHMSDRSSGRKRTWIDSLRSAGKRPHIESLEVVKHGDCVEAERFWISYFRFLGADLMNVGKGGEQIYRGLEYYQNNKGAVMAVAMPTTAEQPEESSKERWLLYEDEQGDKRIICNHGCKEELFEVAKSLQSKIISLETLVRGLSKSLEDAINGELDLS